MQSDKSTEDIPCLYCWRERGDGKDRRPCFKIVQDEIPCRRSATRGLTAKSDLHSPMHDNLQSQRLQGSKSSFSTRRRVLQPCNCGVHNASPASQQFCSPTHPIHGGHAQEREPHPRDNIIKQHPRKSLKDSILSEMAEDLKDGLPCPSLTYLSIDLTKHLTYARPWPISITHATFIACHVACPIREPRFVMRPVV